MKIFINTLSGLMLAIILSISTAHAFLIDNLLGSADLGNSGDATELALVKTLTGDDTLTLDTKVGTVSTDVLSNGAGSWYLDIGPNELGFFLLKFGTGGFSVDDTYVFENIGDLTKLVWSDDQVNNLTGGCGSGKCNTGRLSHYTGFGGEGGTGGPNEVPEPISLLLISSGLIGFAFLRRRKLV